MKPIFVLSLLRSGSTMLQSILATHVDVATAPEPSILLPCLYSTRSSGIYTNYHHAVIRRRIERFCQDLPNGTDDYLEAAREFAMELYRKAAGRDVRYFLDKTPSYAFIAEEVIRLFPDGKFIFLWRDPLAVVSSTVRTFCQGEWRVLRWNAHFYEGLAGLIAAWEKHSDRACAVRYEDFVSRPEAELARLMAYLELPYDQDVLTDFASNWPGAFRKARERTGVTRYDTVSQEPLTKWHETLRNPIRKAWCRQYLRWIGRERLAVMGYDEGRLLRDLAELPFSLSHAGPDAAHLLRGMVMSVLELGIVGPKLRRPSDWLRASRHG